MEDQTVLYQTFGWLASITLMLGYLPQAIQTIRTRRTDDISLASFVMIALGGICFILHGFLHKPEVLWALVIPNTVTTLCSVAIFSIKMYNDYFKKK